jgi:class 3 adenylate cyclase/ABC-type branched-subunit amino acid transport system substrate-binding protein
MNSFTSLPQSPTICIYHTGNDWDHYLIFAITEINSGLYPSLNNVTFTPKYLYADPYSPYVEGEAQSVFSTNYPTCHAFVGPAWTTQLSAVGEWAGLAHKPMVSGGATSPIFALDNYNYVSRTIPGELNVLEAFVQLIVEYNLSKINIVYANDEYGVSVVEALIEMSLGKFEVELIRSFESVEDVESIQLVLDDLETSVTSVTFLGMTVLFTKDFLNEAGKRGMHERHLWLSPTAIQVASELDPPSTGGVWGISYGEELTEDMPLAKRYLEKDPKPHIEAAEYGFDDQYETLTYWGSYAYDAVLAVASGLVAAANISDGEEVLWQIRSLSLNNTNTGVLTMDEHGDRVGARIPVFFVDSDGASVQFAVYYDGTVDLIQDPLWPGGSTTQPPDLIRSEETSGVSTLVLAIVLPLMVLLLLILGYRLWKARKSARDTSLAPKTAPCCLLFTDIQSSSTLWGVAPVEMSKAIDTHHSVIRSCLVANGAYEVKTIGDCFMIACKSPNAALNLAVEMQDRLFHAEWDPAIDACYRNTLESGAHESSVWHGLRVRTSVHFGEPEIQFDEASKGFDYYGNMVNETARIEGLANGGQIVVSEAFRNALNDNNISSQISFLKLGEYELRGCPDKVNLLQVTPKRFESRKFPPLRTGDEEKNNADMDDDNSDLSDWVDHDFDLSSLADSDVLGQRQHSKWFKTLFSVFKAKPRRDIVDKLCGAWHVRNEDQLVRRVARVSSTSDKVLARGASSTRIIGGQEKEPLLSNKPPVTQNRLSNHNKMSGDDSNLLQRRLSLVMEDGSSGCDDDEKEEVGGKEQREEKAEVNEDPDVDYA